MFCLSTLVEYMEKSRKFVDPGSQVAFTDSELLAIEDAAEAAGFPRPNLVVLRNNKDAAVHEKNKLDLTYGIDRMIENLVAEMLELILSRGEKSEVERQLWGLFDQVGQYYQQLCADPENIEFAVQCRVSYIRFIKGPKTHPTPDREGLLTMCLEFFDRLALFTDVFVFN